MCGVFGIYSFNHEIVKRNTLEKMEKTIQSRGPDDKSIYIDGSVGLGMNRLAILDLNHGKQPFISHDGNIIVFQNGEIYNYIELKKLLEKEGYVFKSHCDTEVILKAYELWGAKFISRLNGMFSIVIYEKNTKILRLFRDRIGVKPLYYYQDSTKIVFASEIKAILEGGASKKISLPSLHKGMLYGYIPCPHTIFQDIQHIKPGSYLEIFPTGKKVEKIWWDIGDYVSANQDDVDQAKNHIAYLCQEATKIRLRSDVEVGAFLSGGLDSSYVVSMMRAHSDEKLKTYSIGFEDKRFDETPFALAVSKLFDSTHEVQYLKPDAIDIWKQVVYINDQPHSDVSFIPTFKVAEMASHSLKVVLTGDGGDEVFAGYDKYNFLEGVHLSAVAPNQDMNLYAREKLFITDEVTKDEIYHATKMGEFIGENDDQFFHDFSRAYQGVDSINKALIFDMIHLMPSNNLVKPDRMGMAHSIEARSPFLDYRLIEYVFGLPGHYKIKNGEKKYILKLITENIIGKDLTYRKKQMFTVPIGDWFQTKLATLLEEKINSALLREFELFNAIAVTTIVKQHIAGTANHTRLLRFLVSFVYFLETFLGEKNGT